MGSHTEKDEILPSKLTEMSDFDALEKQLDTVLGTLQEKIPTVEVTPEVPAFQLGATPAYTKTLTESTTQTTTPQNKEQTQEIPTTSSSEFHTISGGPETLREIGEKKVPALYARKKMEKLVPQSGLQTRHASTVFTEEKVFLSSTLFFWFSAVTFIFFVLGAGLPFIMELLVKNNYILLEGNVYRDGTISFPVAIVDSMLLLTFQLTVASIVILIITGTIDYGMKKNFGDLTRAIVHGAIILIFGYIIFAFCRDQGVTQEQVKEVFIILKNAVSGVFDNVDLDNPAL